MVTRSQEARFDSVSIPFRFVRPDLSSWGVDGIGELLWDEVQLRKNADAAPRSTCVGTSCEITIYGSRHFEAFQTGLSVIMMP